MNEKVRAAIGVDVSQGVLGLAFFAAATITPFLIHWQWFTGPLVNALLILMLFFVGLRAALLLALLPSLVALSSGLLPAPLAAVVPFIMIANVLFVLIIDRGRQYYIPAALLAALIKFLFLLAVVSLIVSLLWQKDLASAVASMMSWPQFYTAVLGAAIAYPFLKKFNKIK